MDDLDQIVGGELARGDVHAHDEPVVAAVRDLPAACLPEDPGADRDDQPGFLGERDEAVGPDEPIVRVLPAHERLAPTIAPVSIETSGWK